MQNEIRTLTATDLRVTSATQLDQLGASGFTEDNRQFSYVGVGATGVSAGQLLVTPAVVANHQGLLLAAGSQKAAGSTQLQLTLGATAATASQYVDGYLTVVTGTGAGYAYRIRGNTATAASGVIFIDLVQNEPLITAVDAATTFNLAPNVFSNLITSTTSSHAVGIATTNIAANSFGWVQNYGFCAALIQGTISKGVAIQQSTTTAGAVATLTGTNALLGNTLENCTTGQNNGVWLQIT